MISVILSTYNDEQTISYAIKSILNQSYPNFELIIINDCSTDKTKELIQWIENRGDSLGTTRSPKQLMALGSFRTHMVMGLKALKFAER